MLSCNVGEIVLLAGSVLAGLPLPLTAVQILYVNLATDGLPALALAVDPPEPGLMEAPPAQPRNRHLHAAGRHVVTGRRTVAGLANMALFTWLVRSGRPLEAAMAMTFVSLVLIQFFNAYNSRSEWQSIVRNPFANTVVEPRRGVGVAAARRGGLSAVPAARLRDVQPGAAGLGAEGGGLSFTIVPVLETVKWAARRGWLGELT